MPKSNNYIDELEVFESEEERIKFVSSSIWKYNLYEIEEEIREACEVRDITYEYAMKYKDFWLKIFKQ